MDKTLILTTLIVAACEVALGSKIVNQRKRDLAEVCVDALMAVYDAERNVVNMDLIKIVTEAGGRLEDTSLVRVLLLDEDFSQRRCRRWRTQRLRFE